MPQESGWSAPLFRHIQLRAALIDLKIADALADEESMDPARKSYSARGLSAGHHTRFASVFRVLQPYIQNLDKDAAPKRVLVLGSSLGWSGFFAALLFGVRVDCFEVMKHRHDAAVHANTKSKVGRGSAQLYINGTIM